MSVTGNVGANRLFHDRGGKVWCRGCGKREKINAADVIEWTTQLPSTERHTVKR
jgi:hypothetical protein